MSLLLSASDLRPLFTDADFYPKLFDVIRNSLLQQHDDEPGVVSWLAFPTAHKDRQINLNLLTTHVEGTSIRVFPHRVGEQAKDSMFTLLFDDSDGHLLALISLDELGPLRTAAPVAFASQYLAPKEATTLALFGSGLQARYHLQGLKHALPSLKQVRVYSPTAEHREHFATSMSTELHMDVVPVETPQQAVEHAQVITITAASYKPVLAAEDVQPGTLVTSIAGRAVPPELQSRARVVVPALIGPDHHASGWDPFPFKLNGGRNASTVATTLVDILHQKSSARENESDIVFYEQSGSFAWDGAMTRWLYDWAIAQGSGKNFSISE